MSPAHTRHETFAGSVVFRTSPTVPHTAFKFLSPFTGKCRICLSPFAMPPQSCRRQKRVAASFAASGLISDVSPKMGWR